MLLSLQWSLSPTDGDGGNAEISTLMSLVVSVVLVFVVVVVVYVGELRVAAW